MHTDKELTEAVIGSAFEVSHVLGAGFLEKIYERALIRELAFRDLEAKEVSRNKLVSTMGGGRDFVVPVAVKLVAADVYLS
jgi:GxxExxY protein